MIIPSKSPSVFGWSKSQRLMLDGFCPMSTRMLTSRWLPGSNLPGASGACLRGPQGPGDYWSMTVGELILMGNATLKHSNMRVLKHQQHGDRVDSCYSWWLMAGYEIVSLPTIGIGDGMGIFHGWGWTIPVIPGSHVWFLLLNQSPYILDSGSLLCFNIWGDEDHIIANFSLWNVGNLGLSFQ